MKTENATKFFVHIARKKNTEEKKENDYIVLNFFSHFKRNLIQFNDNNYLNFSRYKMKSYLQRYHVFHAIQIRVIL